MDCRFPHIHFWVVSFPVYFWSPFWRGKWSGKLSLLSTASLNSQNREYKSDCRSVTWIQGRPSWEMALARPRIAVLSKVSCCLLAISVWQMNNTNEQHKWTTQMNNIVIHFASGEVQMAQKSHFAMASFLLRSTFATPPDKRHLQLLAGAIHCSEWLRGAKIVSSVIAKKVVWSKSCIHVFVFMGWRGRFILEGLAVGKCDHRALWFVMSMAIYHCEVVHCILSGDSLPLTQS